MMFLEFFVSQCFVWTFLTLQSFAYILWFLLLFYLCSSVCTNMCLNVCMSCLYVFFHFFYLFVLFLSFHVLFYYFLDAYLYSNERQKGCGFIWVGKCGGSAKRLGRKKHNQNLFSIKNR